MVRNCEIRIGDQWNPRTIHEVLSDSRVYDMRCPKCHGRVFVRKRYGDMVRSHFGHETSHSGCELSGSRYTPPPTMHPNALK
jgi:hypothetical protein